MPNLRMALSCCLILGGCASSPTLVSNGVGVTRVETSSLPAPSPRDFAASDRPYSLGPLDELSIDVAGISEFSQKEIQVDASGRINFPLIGAIPAGGMTPAELARTIEDGLRRNHVRNPRVTVNINRTVSQVVTIDGAVREPGQYPVIGPMSLMRAIATAKGATEFAKLDDVVVFRKVGGQSYAALYSLRAIRQGAYQDPEIFPNDVVLVGTSRGRLLFKDFLALIPLLTTPLIVALQN